MINVLVVVGKNIKYNQPLMAYVERSVQKKLGHIDALYHLDQNDADLFLSLEEIITKSRRVVIVTRDAYALVSKILCTLSADSMVLREDILVPSRAEMYDKESYLLYYHDKYINLLQIREQEKIAPIMIEPKEKGVSFFLVDAEDESEKVKLENIVKIHDVEISQTALVAGLKFIQASGFQHAQYDSFIQALAFAFRDKILFGDNLATIISQRLIENKRSVTCVESCTGGLIASEIVKNSGISAVFNGSIVSYANDIKSKIVGVKDMTLTTYGAVSVQTLYEMLEGGLRLMDADMAIAVSGIAGPTGGTKDKPVGRVYVGAKSRGGETLIEKLTLQGDRIYIQQQAMFWGFKLLLLSDKKFFFNFLPKSLDN